MTLCRAALIIKGEHFQCDQTAPHTGWAHANRAAQAIWCDDGDNPGRTPGTSDEADDDYALRNMVG